MNAWTLEALELEALIELAARHVQTSPGRLRMLKLRPSSKRAEILKQLELTGECTAYLNTQGRFGLSGIEDPDPIVAQLHIEGASLEPRQILKLERLLLTGKDVRESVRSLESKSLFPHLSSLSRAIPDPRPLLKSIQGKILPSGDIDDNASPDLRTVRRDLTERRHRIHRALESILRKQPQAVQEEIITFRGGRFVIPIRTDSRNLVPGVVHGLSTSGQTTFVEPLTVINQNNDLVRLKEQEEVEVARILSSITESLRNNLDSIKATVEALTELDVAQAKALFGVEFECVPPQISDEKKLSVMDARHILLEHSLRSSGERSVPISMEMDESHHVLIISGPNAGGKTVALKTLGLISLMAQMGFHVPARDARLPIFDQVFADIGDHQSISANLSTFTAHMRNIAEMSQLAEPGALILLDEVGTGTDPDEGAALAVAIVEFFRRLGTITVASTHYPKLKMWAAQTDGVLNASVEFDERTLRPTYRLILGIAGSSSGVEIARRMNVDRRILEMAGDLAEPSQLQAREYLQKLKESLDDQKELRSSLEEERAAVAEKYARLDMEFAKREASRSAEFESALEKIVEEFQSDSKRAIRKIKNRVEAARAKTAAENYAAELRGKSKRLSRDYAQPAVSKPSSREVAGDAPVARDDIREGDRVMIQSLDREGTVESIEEDSYTITVGALRFRAELEDLEWVRRPRKPAESSSSDASILDSTEEPASELKVIGLTADEALANVDKFLDRAFLSGVESVRIIHGHGKGILRRAIAVFLADHPQVERFSLAPPQQGGGGATLVELKK
jgi:DNA mismatch repair protein MutS2